MSARHHLVGVDVGGSGVKAAAVDLRSGTLLAARTRLPTPQPATPDAVAEAVAEVARAAGWTGGALGCTVPARVRHGIVETAANIDASWIGVRAAKRFRRALGPEATLVTVLNDADAAGLAEMRWGAGQGETGTTLVITFGTGIGSALFVGRRLVPNTELGHVRIDKRIAERVASDSTRQRDHLTWERWARKRVQKVLAHYEFLFSPDRIIIGGGVSKPDKWALFGHLLRTDAKLFPAALGNEAGIVGAAYAARQAERESA